MFKRSREKRNSTPAQVANGAHTLAHSAEEAVGRVARTAMRRHSNNVQLNAQLAKTSRDLAHESSDLHEAVDTLNAMIKANFKAAKRGRMRLIGGVAIGAAVMYHLDPQHGPERRALVVQRVARLTSGKPSPTSSPTETATPNPPLDG